MGVAGLAVPEAVGRRGPRAARPGARRRGARASGLAGSVPRPFARVLGVLASGNDAEQAAILPGLASGESIATVAFEEEDAAWEPERLEDALRGGRLSGDEDDRPPRGARGSAAGRRRGRRTRAGRARRGGRRDRRTGRRRPHAAHRARPLRRRARASCSPGGAAEQRARARRGLGPARRRRLRRGAGG